MQSAEEGGRDAHFAYGKFGVYPGNNFQAQLIPFIDGAFKLAGKTKKAAAVVTYYTIPYGQDKKMEKMLVTVIVNILLGFITGQIWRRRFVYQI